MAIELHETTVAELRRLGSAQGTSDRKYTAVTSGRMVKIAALYLREFGTDAPRGSAAAFVAALGTHTNAKGDTVDNVPKGTLSKAIKVGGYLVASSGIDVAGLTPESWEVLAQELESAVPVAAQELECEPFVFSIYDALKSDQSKTVDFLRLVAQAVDNAIVLGGHSEDDVRSAVDAAIAAAFGGGDD